MPILALNFIKLQDGKAKLVPEPKITTYARLFGPNPVEGSITELIDFNEVPSIAPADTLIPKYLLALIVKSFTELEPEIKVPPKPTFDELLSEFDTGDTEYTFDDYDYRRYHKQQMDKPKIA